MTFSGVVMTSARWATFGVTSSISRLNKNSSVEAINKMSAAFNSRLPALG